MNLFIFFYTVVSLFVVPRACRPVATKIFIRSRKDNSSLSQSCSKSLSKHGASAPSTLKVQRTPTWPPPERPPVCRSRRTRLKSRRLALRPLRYLGKGRPKRGSHTAPPKWPVLSGVSSPSQGPCRPRCPRCHLCKLRPRHRSSFANSSGEPDGCL